MWGGWEGGREELLLFTKKYGPHLLFVCWYVDNCVMLFLELIEAMS